jgi:hypothetical protein
MFVRLNSASIFPPHVRYIRANSAVSPLDGFATQKDVMNLDIVCSQCRPSLAGFAGFVGERTKIKSHRTSSLSYKSNALCQFVALHRFKLLPSRKRYTLLSLNPQCLFPQLPSAMKVPR